MITTPSTSKSTMVFPKNKQEMDKYKPRKKKTSLLIRHFVVFIKGGRGLIRVMDRQVMVPKSLGVRLILIISN